MVRKQFKGLKTSLVVAAIVVVSSSCGSSSSSGTEDASTSGSVASVVGGSVNNSTSGGTQATLEKRNYIDQMLGGLSPFSLAQASGSCPTFSLSACNTTQTYSDCSFSNSSATWSGGVSYTCSGTLTTGSVTREVANGTTRTNSFGTVVTIDSTGSLTTYQGSISGGGTTVTIGSGTVSSVAINGVRLVGSNGQTFDHTITGTVANSGSSFSGTVTTYHNLLHITATSLVADLTFSAGCCLPTGGTITTTFSGASALKSGYVGSTEILTFTGCGTANYTGPETTATSVTLSNCI